MVRLQVFDYNSWFVIGIGSQWSNSRTFSKKYRMSKMYDWEIYGYIGNPDENKRKKTLFFNQFVSEIIGRILRMY